MLQFASLSHYRIADAVIYDADSVYEDTVFILQITDSNSYQMQLNR